MRIIILACVVWLLTGCVGLAVGGFGPHEQLREATLSKAEVQSQWGTPQRTFQQGRCEVWGYNNGRSWQGIWGLAVVVPVPLMLPTGTHEKRIYFIDQTAIATVTEFSELTSAFGLLCGSNECGLLGGAVNTDTQLTQVPEACTL